MDRGKTKRKLKSVLRQNLWFKIYGSKIQVEARDEGFYGSKFLVLNFCPKHEKTTQVFFP